ncbi:MAG: beta-ketoacyl synthase N-terminal-like domain-containing protein [Thermoanaerobaculales bacterium]
MSRPPIAIVGIGGVFPSSPDLEAFWEHIAAARDNAREAPAGRWILDPGVAHDPNPRRPDRVVSRRACFVDAMASDLEGLAVDRDFFDSLDVSVQLALQACRDAWREVETSGVDPARVGVILGSIALPTDHASELAAGILGKHFERELFARREAPAPVNRFVTGLPAGLVAKALGLGGGHLALDAACASSLFALKLAVDELQAGRSDVMLCGGLSRPDSLYTQMGFSQLTALSPSGRCAPFDRTGDGLVVGEGAGVVALKRLADAVADRDAIHAVIRGIGLANDVEGSLLAPSSEGQLRAMRAAYLEAGWEPRSIGLIECHATGTPVGDAVEFASLRELWGEEGWREGQCTIGSVKSNVGHLLTGAGAASLIKVLFAMRHRTLPPTANFSSAQDAVPLADSPFVVRREEAPWVSDEPLRAAISGFGFGGTDAHVLLEEYVPQTQDRARPALAVTGGGQPVAIIGMAAAIGPWEDLESFQHRVLGGGPDVAPSVKRNYWGLDDAPRGFFLEEITVPIGAYRIPPREIEEALPQQLLMLELGRKALAHARCEAVDRLRTGVFVGIGLDLNTTNYHLRWAVQQQAGQISGLEDGSHEDWVADLCDRVSPALNANRVLGNLGGIVASRLARELGIGGPSFILSSEESSGFSALAAAVRALERGELDCALIGAVDLTSDPRQTISDDALRTRTRSDRSRPFDVAADGALPADGGVALVLKPLAAAHRDGDRIFAVVKGLGSTTGGSSSEIEPTAESYRRALRLASEEAETPPSSIGLLVAHGSGHPPSDRVEAEALAGFFAEDHRPALGSAIADVGHSGAASFLAALAKTALCLHHSILPPLRGLESAHGDLAGFVLPQAPQYWLHDRADGPRRAGVSTMSSTGAVGHVVLEQAASASGDDRPLGPPGEALFVAEGASRKALHRALDRLQALAGERGAVHALADRWWRDEGRDETAQLGLGLVARDSGELEALVGIARAALDGGSTVHSRRVFFKSEPLGADAEIAFVFPGAGGQFAGMGRELSAHWPAILRSQEERFQHLRAQLGPELIWNAAEPPRDTERLILAQAVLGTVVSDLLRSFDVEPSAALGYSLGETTALFALGAWRDRDEMWRRVRASELFTSELAGPCRAAAQAWGLGADSEVRWRAAVLEAPPEAVQRAVAGEARAYLLIIKTAGECVIGGEEAAVDRVVASLGVEHHRLEGVPAVHCEVAAAVAEQYRELHLLETTPPPGVRFYSGVRGEVFPVDADRVADAILDNSLNTVDWPKTVLQAWTDGARIFLEMGPGAACTRMISVILGDRPHLARALATSGLDGVSSLLRTLGALVAERVPVKLDSLYAEVGEPVETPAVIKVPVGRPAEAERRLPLVGEGTRTEAGGSRAPAEVGPIAPVTHGAEAGTGSVAERLVQIAAASADAHESFLRLMERTRELIAVNRRPRHEIGEACEFGRELCLEFAVGSVAKVLGPQFAPVDNHPTRVRLPDEPLMLVDRILHVEGEALSMSPGSVVTEHDILENAWYLDGGRIPTCIAVEAGQADLFLSGYLGIDFETRGHAVYRLLDAVVTFHDQLPRPGEVIRYHIEILRFFRQSGTWLFNFQFEASVGGRPLMTMRNGCAGFFTKAELEAGRGIVHSRLEAQWERRTLPADWRPLAPVERCSLESHQVDALRAGDLEGAFGSAFAHLGKLRPLTIPAGRMRLVDRVPEIDPEGGRYGIGFIRAEADIRPDDWFLTCHFVDDKVMPGTLMYECCLHTLRIFLLRLGWVADSEEAVAQPVVGVASVLKCRGQVLDTTRLVTYEVSLKEIGYGSAPYAIADAMMYADGRPIVEITDMCLRLTGVTRAEIEALWPPPDPGSRLAPAFGAEKILAFADGSPSEAFGEPYEIFDNQRTIARLPRPPFLFLDRIMRVTGEPFVMTAGAACEAQVDIRPDRWYFASNRQQEIPYSVLLEMALQPCGWLAAHVGSALASETDLKFRNLGGEATQHVPVLPEDDTLVTRAELTSVSQSAGMIIQHFDFVVRSERHGRVYEGTSYFGFFSEASLAEQVGIRDAELYRPTAPEVERASSFEVRSGAPFADTMMRMIDRVDCLLGDGGPHGLGFISGSIDVDPDAWFFDAHFYQDPVWPGSLGLEGFMQLMKVFAVDRWRLGGDARFATTPIGLRHRWQYRGQVIPTDGRVSIEVHITSLDDASRQLGASGFLSVDGRTIYRITDFGLVVR